MKHRPIALLDESTPVICVVTDSPVMEKMLSNVAEVRARGADVIAVATEGAEAAASEVADRTVVVPPHRLGDAADRIAIVPLQLLAYHRPPQRAQRRSAAQPREDGDGRVGAGAAMTTEVRIDLLEIGRMERAIERHPRLAERVHRRRARLRPRAGAPPRTPPRRPLRRQGGGGQGFGLAKTASGCGRSRSWRASRQPFGCTAAPLTARARRGAACLADAFAGMAAAVMVADTTWRAGSARMTRL